MKRWLILIPIVLVLTIAGFTTNYWSPPLIKFVTNNSQLIQSFSNALQIIAFALAWIVAPLWFFLRNRKKDRAQPAGNRNVILENAKDNLIITGDPIINLPPGKQADPKLLRQAYLNHLFESIRNLSLGGVDPKAASDPRKAGLHLDAFIPPC